MADDYYKRSYNAPPGSRQYQEHQNDYEMNPIGHIQDDSFEQILTEKAGKKKLPPQKDTRLEPLMQEYKLQDFSEEHRPAAEATTGATRQPVENEWKEIPPNYAREEQEREEKQKG
jgi:hypothetical protein